MLIQQERIISEFRDAIERIDGYSKDTNERVNDALEEITNGVDYMRKLGDKKLQTDGKK